MPTYSTNEFRVGLKILLNGDPYTITDNEFVKPGKGQAFNRVKLRNLKSSKTTEKTFKSGEKVDAADIHETEMQYLYNDGESWHFMNQDTFEQIEVSNSVVAETSKWIKEEDICNVMLWNGNAISVEPPNFVVLEVTETDPGLKGDTSGGGSKPATCDTGAVVRVPLFIQIGDKIKIDTRTAEYSSRAKD